MLSSLPCFPALSAIPTCGWCHRGDRGDQGCPTFWTPFKKNGDIFKPSDVCTSDSSIHVNIVMVSAVLALDVILTEGVWFSGHIPRPRHNLFPDVVR